MQARPTTAKQSSAQAGATINSAVAKAIPVGNDKFGFWDSGANILKQCTLTNLLAIFCPIAGPGAGQAFATGALTATGISTINGVSGTACLYVADSGGITGKLQARPSMSTFDVGTISNHPVAIYVNSAEQARFSSTGLSVTGGFTLNGASTSYSILNIKSNGGIGNGYAAALYLNNTDGVSAQLNISDSGAGTASYVENNMVTLCCPTGFGFKLNTNNTSGSGFRIDTAGNIAATGSVTASGGFGCNSKTAQTAYASGGAAPSGGTGATAGAYDTAANRDALITLVNNLRTALINCGIMS